VRAAWQGLERLCRVVQSRQSTENISPPEKLRLGLSFQRPSCLFLVAGHSSPGLVPCEVGDRFQALVGQRFDRRQRGLERFRIVEQILPAPIMPIPRSRPFVPRSPSTPRVPALQTSAEEVLTRVRRWLVPCEVGDRFQALVGQRFDRRQRGLELPEGRSAVLVVLFGSRSGENLNVLLSTRSHTLRTSRA
jgi:hypothetical protein